MVFPFPNWLFRLFGTPDPRPRRAKVSLPGAVVPVGPEYAPDNLPPRARFATTCDFVAYLREMLPRVGLTGASVDLFAAHLGRECGFGKSVYDYNFGNIRVFHAQDAPWYRHRDGLPYHAYMNAAEGLRAAVDFVAGRSRYAKAWAALKAGDVKWYSELGIAGYYQTHDPVTHRVIDVTPENVGRCQRDYEEHALATVKRCMP